MSMGGGLGASARLLAVKLGCAAGILFGSIVASPLAANPASWPNAPLPSPTGPIPQDWPLPSEQAYANAMDEVMLTPPCSDSESVQSSLGLTRRVDRYVASFEARFGRKPDMDPNGDISYYDSPDCDIGLFETHSRRASKALRVAEKQLYQLPLATTALIEPAKP
jgi:hypothetical protein